MLLTSRFIIALLIISVCIIVFKKLHKPYIVEFFDVLFYMFIIMIAFYLIIFIISKLFGY